MKFSYEEWAEPEGEGGTLGTQRLHALGLFLFISIAVRLEQRLVNTSRRLDLHLARTAETSAACHV